MRRFVSRTLFCQYNTFTKGFPVRRSHFPSSADVKVVNADETTHRKESKVFHFNSDSHYFINTLQCTGGMLIPQGQHISLPILDSAVPSPTVPPKAEDEILKAVHSASTLSQLLESISSNVKSMQEEHLASAIQKVIFFQKNPR